MVKIIVILTLITAALSACMDSNCIDCESYIFNFTVQETCKTCRKDFLVDEKGKCRIDKQKFAILISVGVLIIIGFIFLRRLLIAYNDKREKLYTAELQDAVFDYMKSKKHSEAVQERAYVAITERALNNKNNVTQQQGLKICDLCKQGIQFGDKKVDTFSKCKHHYHGMCLRNHLNQKFKEQNGMLYGKCPACKDRLRFLSIYCQTCMIKHRDIQIREHDSLYLLCSFTCFRCKAIAKKNKRQEQKNCCNGLGQYLCCHCFRD